MLFMREMYTSEGRMCRKCLGSAFARHQLRNLTLGWWGMISFVMTWVFLFGNTATYVSARWELRGHDKRLDERNRVDHDDAESRLLAFDGTIARRLRHGESPDHIAADIAEVTGVPNKRARAFVEEQIE
jgi:hypothetical protein